MPDTLFKVIISLSVAAFVVGSLFRIMHWPFSIPLVVIGYVGIVVTYPQKMLRKKDRTMLDLAKGFAILAWAGFKLTYFFLFMDENTRSIATRDYRFLDHIGTIFLMIWIGYTVFDYMKINGEKNSFSRSMNVLLISGMLILGTGYFFKMLHWPGASYLLIGGASIAAIPWFVGIFQTEKESENEGSDEILDS